MGIESSCDETAIAILADGREILSNIISSQISIHTVYGGVVPEIASRHHLNNIPFVFRQALDEAGLTYGPDGDIIIITFDAVNAALEECLAGNINLCVECNPMHGPRVANLIRQLEAGETPEKLVYVDETWFSYRRISESDLSERPY